MADNYTLAKTGEQIDERITDPLPVSLGGTGQTAYAQNVSGVVYDTTTFSNHGVTVVYFPYLRMCYVRGYVALDHVSLEENTMVTAVTIPENYRPNANVGLSVCARNGPRAILHSKNSADYPGQIRIGFDDSMASTGLYDIFFSGWWIV